MVSQRKTKKLSSCEDNHEYLDESFLIHFMSRNRVHRGMGCTSKVLSIGHLKNVRLQHRSRHIVLHPQALGQNAQNGQGQQQICFVSRREKNISIVVYPSKNTCPHPNVPEDFHLPLRQDPRWIQDDWKCSSA